MRCLRWIKFPRVSAEGQLQYLKDPAMIASGGYDGCVIITDLREGGGNIVTRTRGFSIN